MVRLPIHLQLVGSYVCLAAGEYEAVSEHCIHVINDDDRDMFDRSSGFPASSPPPLKERKERSWTIFLRQAADIATLQRTDFRRSKIS
jgi:hypothetical protein